MKTYQIVAQRGNHSLIFDRYEGFEEIGSGDNAVFESFKEALCWARDAAKHDSLETLSILTYDDAANAANETKFKVGPRSGLYRLYRS